MQLVIGRDHPSLTGHFPGNPIVPGAMILASIIDELGRIEPALRVIGIGRAKFLTPLRPDQTFEWHYARGRDDRLSVRAAVGENRLLDAQLRVAA